MSRNGRASMRLARYPIARCGEIAENTCRSAELADGWQCCVFLHQGRYFAVASECPHQRAPLQDAHIGGGELTCRRHGFRFDLRTGECLTASGYTLPTFRVEVEGDVVYVLHWEPE